MIYLIPGFVLLGLFGVLTLVWSIGPSIHDALHHRRMAREGASSIDIWLDGVQRAETRRRLINLMR